MLKKFSQLHKHYAFTLVEVLITLTIIGVVAAIILPTLVNNFQNKAWNTSAKVFERRLNEALKIMNTQKVLAGHTNTYEFVNELAKHFKIIKVCNNNINECFENNITWNILNITGNTTSETVYITNIKTARDLGQDWDSDTVGIQFANGTTGVLAYNPNCEEQPFSNQFSGTSCISLIYDTDGKKNPNTFNKDVRSINSFLKSCTFKSNGVCFGAWFNPGHMTKTDCEKEKNVLGIKKCFSIEDYWAGSVKACGGVDKLPTAGQLRDIAKYLYNTDYIGMPGLTRGILDYDRVAAIGINVTDGASFAIWGGDEPYGSDRSYTRSFSSNGTATLNNFRYSPSNIAICRF